MPRCDSLRADASTNPGGLSFTEVCRLAVCWGYEHKSTRGSHSKYKHRHLKLPQEEAIASFQKGKNGEAKKYQVEQLLDKIAYIRTTFPTYDPDDPSTHPA